MKLKVRETFARLNQSAQAKALAIGTAVMALPFMAHAEAIDVSAATSGIGDGKTAILAVLSVMISAFAAIWGVRQVLRLFRG